MALESEESSKNGKLPNMAKNQVSKRPIKEKLFPHFPDMVKPNGKNLMTNEDEMVCSPIILTLGQKVN